MKNVLLILLAIATVSFAGIEQDKKLLMGDYWIDIGTPTSEALGKLMREPEVSYLNGEASFLKYGVTVKPYGVIAHRFRYKFENGKLVHCSHTFGKWTNMLKIPVDQHEGDEINSAFIKKIESMKYEQKVIKSADGKELEFKLSSAHCYMKIDQTDGISGDIQIFNDPSFKNQNYSYAGKQWFGLGYLTKDSVVRTGKTSTISMNGDSKYIWVVDNDLNANSDMYLQTRFPSAITIGQLPIGASFDKKENVLTMPLGKQGGVFKAEFTADKSDPLGTYVMFLATKKDTVAAVSYQIKK